MKSNQSTCLVNILVNNLCTGKLFKRIALVLMLVWQRASQFILFKIILYPSLSPPGSWEKFLESFLSKVLTVLLSPLTQRTLLLVRTQHNLPHTRVVSHGKLWMAILIPILTMDTVHIQSQIPAPAGGVWTWVQIMCQSMKCALLIGFPSTTVSGKEVETIS